ncbi:hypothetical protein CPSG_03069 [Coccidioides posadasii str. Silveira]|uniref:Uncharacterized protein n=2 Tax=Coccidioides posadasii TaxID=199306 RepID=E9D0P0_COCPS|nr:hypothetical protein CPSG_03069 [Coccidioides posadasii str. Silveira]KMM73535.1 hypothetical protein CPAG_09822 [Coccidioides posadasii RMSCC 3488]
MVPAGVGFAWFASRPPSRFDGTDQDDDMSPRLGYFIRSYWSFWVLWVPGGRRLLGETMEYGDGVQAGYDCTSPWLDSYAIVFSTLGHMALGSMDNSMGLILEARS